MSWLAICLLPVAACGPAPHGSGGDLRLAFAGSPLDGPCPETATAPVPPPSLERLRLSLWRADGKLHGRADLRLGSDGVVEWKASPGKNLILQAVGVVGGTEAFLAYAGGIDLDAGRPAQVDLFFSPISAVGCAARPLSSGRAFAAGGSLPDGRVVVAGGADRVFTLPGCTGCLELAASAACDVFEPGTGSMYPTARLNRARLLASATPLSNGNLLVVGGASRVRIEPGTWPLRVDPADLVPSFEVYVSAEDRWIEKPLPSGRMFHSATTLSDGRVLIAGGGTDPAQATAEALVYDPGLESAGDVRPFQYPLHAARLSHRAVPISSNRVLFVGGAVGAPAAEVFDPARSGDPFVDLNLSGADANLFFFEAAPIPGRADEILLAGGSLPDGGGGLAAPAAQNVRVLSISRAEAKAGPAMTAGRYLPALLPLSDRRLVLAGGLAGADAAPQAAKPIVATADVSLAPFENGGRAVSLGAARAGATAVPVLGRVLLLGGFGEGKPLASGEIVAGRPWDVP